MLSSVIGKRARTWRWATVAIVGVVLLVGAAAPAAADATGGRHAVTFNLSCGGVDVTVVTPSSAAATAQVIDGSGTLVATDITITLTFTDPRTGNQVTEVEYLTYGAGHGQAGGLQDRLVTCTQDFTINDPDVGPIAVMFEGSFYFAPKQ
jgi:hypothetical protein